MTSRQPLTVATSMLAGALLALVATACAQSDSGQTAAATAPAAAAQASTAPAAPMAGAGMEGRSEGSMQLHRIMTEGAKQPMPMTGSVDSDFASMMIMHHKQAMAMADVLLQHGSNAELKAMAKKMQDEQRKEITELEKHTQNAG